MFAASGPDAWRRMFANVKKRTFRMPPKSDTRSYDDGGIFPIIDPPFKLKPGSKVFTIGSCFAREVEAVLAGMGFDVPVSRFTMHEGELDLPAPHLLNEYNAGTIIQRLESVSGSFSFEGDKGVEQVPNGVLDMFLHIGSAPVTPERLQERRRQIDELYKEILSADVVVITLGLVESWYDKLYDCYLNRAPTQRWCNAEPDRFQFQRMDLEDVHSRMSRAIELLIGLGVRRILVTVSPVPLEATFMSDSNPIANSYSKAVLRVSADLLAKAHPDIVSYFPSFEIVNSYGTRAFLEDNTHVERWVVEKIMRYLVECYVDHSEPIVSLPAEEAAAAERDVESGADLKEAMAVDQA